MSIRECRASKSSMWSRKPMPVAIEDAPVPSRSTATSTSVSLVARLIDALRMTCPAVVGRGPFIRARPDSPLRRPFWLLRQHLHEPGHRVLGSAMLGHGQEEAHAFVETAGPPVVFIGIVRMEREGKECLAVLPDQD